MSHPDAQTAPPPASAPDPEQAPAPPRRSRIPLALGIVAGIACLVLVLVLVLAVVAGGVLFWRSGAADRGETSSAPLGAGPDLPSGVTAGEPYIELSTSSGGPVVDLYVDFLCPHCATFEEVQGPRLREMAEAGEITLRVHPRSMLDAQSTPAGYSGRAANAALCAYGGDPGNWFDASAALFADQPDAAGYSDAELREKILESTGVETRACIDTQRYVPWIRDVVEPEALASTQGTPAVLIDGEQFTGDYTEPGALADAIAAA